MKNKIVIWFALPSPSDPTPLIIGMYGPFDILESKVFLKENRDKVKPGEKMAIEELLDPEKIKRVS